MRRHAKASTAGSTQRQANGLGRFFRGALATRGASSDSKGSGAPAVRQFATGALIAFALFLVLASSASAITTRQPLGFSPITGAGTGVTLHFPSGIAVDETSGNVFVNDGGVGNVNDIFGAEGGLPVGVASPYQINGSFTFFEEPSGAAVDNAALSPSKGALYVADVLHSKVKKFVRNGGTEKYEAAGELTPTSGPGFGEPPGVAVDSKGNIFVADYESESVVKFGPTGTQLARIDTSPTLGTPSSVAVDNAGDLFVQGFGSTDVYKYPANGSGEIEPAVHTFVVSGATGVAVDRAANELFVGLGNHVNQYDAATLAQQLEFGSGVLGSSTRIAVNSTTNRVYVSDEVKKNVAVFGAAVKIPTVTANAASGISPTVATLNGTVNPDGLAVTECKFEYGTTTAYGSTKSCEGAIPTDSSDHAVTGAIASLTPGTTYHFRIVATNAEGANKSADATFATTNPVTTDPASGVTGTKATLNGTVRPEGAPVTECKFEYGTTTAYGSTKPCEGAIPADNGEHPVTAALTALVPNGTTYHFRIVITGGSGTVQGDDRSFATANTVITDPATAVSGAKATLNGAVNPEGQAITECKFEYGQLVPESGQAFNFQATVPCAETPASIGTGTSPVPVHADLSGLAPNGTTYRFRLVAANSDGPVNGSTQSFTTANMVITLAASALTTTTATLNGSVNPDGETLSGCVFEWGPYIPPEDEWGEPKKLTGVPPALPETAPCVPNAAGVGTGTSPVAVHADISGLHPGTAYAFRLEVTYPSGMVSGGEKTLQTSGASILASWPQDVLFDEATLKADVNPEGQPTTYRFEWGTTTAYGNTSTESLVGSDSSAHRVSAFLEGLTPGTTYHYRVIASNATAVNEGPDQTFTTYRHAVPKIDCPNQEFRAGPAAPLPDCRAYEMVSPIDKNGGDILADVGVINKRTSFDESAVEGNKLTYSAAATFGDQLAGRGTSQYIATRGPAGWSTHGINAPRTKTIFGNAFVNFGSDLFNPFQMFTSDLSSAWLYDTNEEPITSDAPSGFVNVYQRDNVGGSYKSLITAPPTNFIGKGIYPNFGGQSSDGSHVAFNMAEALTPSAAPVDRILQTYDYSGGELHLVSVLPDGTPYTKNSSPGTIRQDGGGSPDLGGGVTGHAVSEDGSRIFWTAALPEGGNTLGQGAGTLYVRENPAQPQSALNGSGECTEPAKACTILVAEGTESDKKRFWAASADGSKAIYTTKELDAFVTVAEGKGALKEFDVDSKTTTTIAAHADGVTGASDDLSYIYFTSTEALDAGARAGEPNLYLDHEGDIHFIATLLHEDASPFSDSPNNPGSGSLNERRAILHTARVTPDGRHLVFESAASLTGYDTHDANNGRHAREVYLYDAEAEQLSCASCNPSGARPRGHLLPDPYTVDALDIGHLLNSGKYAIVNSWTAAWIPTLTYTVYHSRTLSNDGSRLFFNAYDALVPQDTNGAQDVYEWEAVGTGDCELANPSFSEVNDGCISLISTGESPERSEFIDATPNGSEVFFETLSSIDPRDPGLIDIYDARVNGGFSIPPSTPECFGDACQSAPEAPRDPTPASASFRGAGNPAPHKQRRSCRARVRHAGKGKANRKQTKKRCKHANRRAGR